MLRERFRLGSMALPTIGVCLAGFVASASAGFIDSAVITTRIFNDDPDSVVMTTNLYPALISISDSMLDGDGMGGEFANRHNFRLSSNGGISSHVFSNDTRFEFYSDVTISGTANSEGGLNLSPWWSQEVDGVFMLNAGTGEVAAFGGRLPFYSFTGEFGINYTKGSTVSVGMIYEPNGLSMADPATIQYTYEDDMGSFMSAVLSFDEGNPAEDPPYGLWGMLNDARLGGYFQAQIDVGNPDNFGEIQFENMSFIPEPAALILLGLGGMVLLRRSRQP